VSIAIYRCRVRVPALTTLDAQSLVCRSYFHEVVIGSSTGSQIEGTQSSFSVFVLLASAGAPGVPSAGVQKVSNYVAAKHYKYILRAHVLPTFGVYQDKLKLQGNGVHRGDQLLTALMVQKSLARVGSVTYAYGI
jgi:hypothetical protein